MTHTPGPWAVGVSSPDVPGALCIRDSKGWGIAHCFGVGSKTNADAALIATAPDLLAALKDCAESLARLPDIEGAYRATCLAEARAAIRKAERTPTP